MEGRGEMEGEERERVVGRKGREKERRRKKKWGEEGRIGKEEQEKEIDGEHGVEKLRFLNHIHTVTMVTSTFPTPSPGIWSSVSWAVQ